MRNYDILSAISMLSYFFGMTGIWISQTVTKPLVLVFVLFEIHRCCISFYTADSLDE